MNKYQEALNRIKTAPSFMGGTDLYKTHLNSSELFLQDIVTLQELIDKYTPKKPNIIFRTVVLDIEQLTCNKPMTYCCPNCNQVVNDLYHNYCNICGQALDWIYI